MAGFACLKEWCKKTTTKLNWLPEIDRLVIRAFLSSKLRPADYAPNYGSVIDKNVIPRRNRIGRKFSFIVEITLKNQKRHNTLVHTELNLYGLLPRLPNDQDIDRRSEDIRRRLRHTASTGEKLYSIWRRLWVASLAFVELQNRGLDGRPCGVCGTLLFDPPPPALVLIGLERMIEKLVSGGDTLSWR